MNGYRHFTGDYRAWFRPHAAQTVFTHTFENLRPDTLEIRNLRPLSDREVDAEITGDYLYFPLIRARKKNAFARILQSGACDVVILADESLAFSEDLEQVILQNHSSSRLEEGSRLRHPQYQRLGSEAILLSGKITFSVPLVQTVPAEVPAITTVETAIQTANRPLQQNIGIPDLILNRIPEPVLSAPARAAGCFGLLFSLAKWAFYMLLFLALLGWLGNWLKQDAGTREDGQAQVESDKPRLNPEQDTLAPMPWDYLTDHRVRWNDFIKHSFLAAWSTSSKQFEDSRKMHPAFANPQVSEAITYWNAVYSEFSRRDLPKLDSLAWYFKSEQKRKNLNSVQTAEMVITFIQEIPYCLIHEASCSEASRQADFIREYHSSGKPCLPNIIAGVQSPYEFMHNLKGDCDTRSLLGFSILSRLGIPASVWVSEAYGHSVLGVGLGSGSNYYKMAGGIRHSAVELTAKGFRLGMISPEQGDMNNWQIALYKN